LFKKGAFTLLLTVALVLGIAASSYADPGKGKGNWKAKGHANWKVIQLTDISSHWAEEPIRAMTLQGVVLGYTDFSFRPNAPVTKFEAVMMIAKASGYEGSVGAEDSWDISVPLWMRGCLDYAVEAGILSKSEASSLKGWEPAKRYEVAVWASRAMKLNVDSGLSFQDLDEIPVFARPYVGGMFRYRYMVGYPGNFFQPNKPVTRAELAAVLYRIMLEHPPGNAVYRVVKGEVDEVNEDSIEIGNKTYGITGDTEIFVNSKKAALEDVKEDARVTAFVDYNNEVILLYARDNDKEDDDEDDGDTGEEVKLSSLTPADGSDDVDPATGELVAKFDAEIEAVDGLEEVKEGIKVRNVTDSEDLEIDRVSIDGMELTIKLTDFLEGGKTYRVTIGENVIEAGESGRGFPGISGGDWEFSAAGSLKIVGLDPRDGANNVDGSRTKVLKARFDDDLAVVSGKGLLGAVAVYNRSDDKNVDVDKVEIDDDTLVITLEDYLEDGDTFEVTIKPGYLEDEDTGTDFAGIDSGDWRFSTKN